MNLKEQNIATVEPKAILTGGLNGARFIAKVQYEDGTSKLYSILPPDYNVVDNLEIKEYILDAAVAKYGYNPIEDTTVGTTEEYENLLRKINEPNT